MKLLLDQNLSPRLVSRLADIYPGSLHVSTVGLDTASDREVWDYARDNNFILVSKDADFSEMSMLLGAPPKVIWLQLGNCTTDRLEQELRTQSSAVRDLVADPALKVLRVAHP